MKQKFGIILIFIGCILSVIMGYSSTLALPVVILGGFLLGSAFLLFSCVYSGVIWGIKIPSPQAAKFISLYSTIGLLFGGFAFWYLFRTMLSYLIQGKFIMILVTLALFIVPAVISPKMAKNFTQNFISKQTNALSLGEIDLFKDIDDEIKQSKYFVVGFEGIALFSDTNYCFAVYRYEDYQLGELSIPEEVALVGTYFVQKYNDLFNFKIDVEVIPGEPGQTVVAVGTGGIAVARVKGTADQHLFRSYIFTRR